jgi:glycosyltransferase involved in cell wall biosynthesis
MKFFIVSHSSGMDGPIDYFEAYLQRQGHNVLKLSHPLDNYRGRVTALTKDGKLVSSSLRRDLGPLSLITDMLITIRKILTNRFDVYVGANNFDTVGAIVCRSIFRVPIKQIIYFASDFSEERFSNSLLNQIYYFIERRALKKSDITISNTQRAHSKRVSLGLDPKKGKVIPNGVYIERVVFPAKQIDKTKFIFVGSVTKEHGLYDLVSSIAPAISRLTIIGQGDDWDRTIELCEQLHIPVELHRNKSHGYVIDYLQRFEGIGLAPYNLKSKWTYYCSPLKVNEYIATGVPVVISSVPEIAKYIAQEDLGVTYDTINSEDILQQLDAFDAGRFSFKAQSFYEKYNYETLFAQFL